MTPPARSTSHRGSRPDIVVDVRPFDSMPVSGQGRYARDLIRHLATLDVPAHFTVWLGQPPSSAFPVPAGWDAQVLRAWTGRGSFTANRLRTGRAGRRADLVHTLHTWTAWPTPRRRVFTVYDLMIDRFPEYQATARSRAYRGYRRAVTASDRVIAISGATRDDLVALWGIRSDRIALVPLAQDPSDWTPSSDAEDRIPVILSPYNLEPRKNLAGLLEAFALLCRTLPEVRLALFGRAAVTPDRERAFEAQVARLDLASAITRTGVLPDTELATWYRRAHVFAFPSLYEGFGLPMLEAMHAGGVVLAHPSPAASEVIGAAGVLADATVPPIFAGALARLLREPGQRMALRRAAQTRAAARTLRDMARETWNVYQSVLAV